MTLTAIILTRNEERNIEECLASVAFADERLVVDSGSTDLTVPVAEKCGARVISHLFVDFADQWNYAMSQAKGDWVLFIDADERVTPELAEEIKQIARDSLCGLTSEIEKAVFAIPFQTYFFGKRLRFGDGFRDVHIRLFPRACVRWDQPVHEQLVTDLPCRNLRHPVLHYTTRNFSHYMAKLGRYVHRELAVMKAKGVRPSLLKVLAVPPARFLQLYLFKLGLLDGLAGFQYAILSAYYSFQKHWLYWKESAKS